MKQLIVAALLLLLFIKPSQAQTEQDIDRKELHDLLDDRKKKFDDYSSSIEKHSGIFGNKTKNDVKRSNEVLVDIVKTDNRIISTLYRVVDFRTFEKVNRNYDLQQKDAVLNNLRHATDTLSKQVEVLKTCNSDLHAKNIRLQWYFYLLLLWTLWMLMNRLRKRKRLNSVD